MLKHISIKPAKVSCKKITFPQWYSEISLTHSRNVEFIVKDAEDARRLSARIQVLSASSKPCLRYRTFYVSRHSCTVSVLMKQLLVTIAS